MLGENFIFPNISSYEPALTNRVARVTIPIKASAVPVAKGIIVAAEKGLTVFDAAKTSLNTLNAEKVYKIASKTTKAVKTTTEKLTYTQALKRFKFSGKAKIFGFIAAAGLVTASAHGF